MKVFGSLPAVPLAKTCKNNLYDLYSWKNCRTAYHIHSIYHIWCKAWGWSCRELDSTLYRCAPCGDHSGESQGSPMLPQCLAAGRLSYLSCACGSIAVYLAIATLMKSWDVWFHAVMAHSEDTSLNLQQCDSVAQAGGSPVPGCKCAVSVCMTILFRLVLKSDRANITVERHLEYAAQKNLEASNTL